MNVSIFSTFGWIMPVHAHKIGVLGLLHPAKWASISTKAKKGTPLCKSASYEPSSVKIWQVV